MKTNASPIQMIDTAANFEFVAGQTYCTGIYGNGCESITIKEIITDSKGQRFAVVTSKGFIVTENGLKVQSYEVKTVKRKIKTEKFEYREGTYESFRLGQTQYNGKIEKKWTRFVHGVPPNSFSLASAGSATTKSATSTAENKPFPFCPGSLHWESGVFICGSCASTEPRTSESVMT